jgi:internalin A
MEVDGLRKARCHGKLDLSGRQLTALPPEVTQLTNLQTLDLTGNALRVLPPEVTQLTNLQTLWFRDNVLTALPPEITHLTNLQTLDLTGNRLTALPPEITHLTNLQTLDLTGNQLTALPPEITQLTNLQTLRLGRNRLSILPPEITQLTNLQTLDVTGNLLSILPPEITQLTNLQTLDLGHNRLRVLPPEITQLTNLQTLHLGHNRLSILPPEITQLTNLQTLDLTGNQLTTLPSELALLLKDGLKLDLGYNPLADPLLELIGRGSDALAAYLTSLEDVVAQFEAKVLLVGEGNVGKTSLVASLLGAPFVANRETTHGIEVHPVTVRHPGLDVDMTIRTWDFGGQEVYRVTHQFFFSRRALYVMVWNAREGQEQNEVEGWLRRIRLRVGSECRAIVVATHSDARQPELDFPQLQRILPGMLAGQCSIDNLSGNGVAELREMIAVEVADLPQMGQLLSRRWIMAREEVAALSECEPQIPYERFVAVCERHGVTGDAVATLVNLLHDLGQVIYYGDDEGLRDLVVLNPEWLTKAIGRVLEDLPARQAQGVLDHARLKGIWQERPDGSGYPIRYHRYFLRLMEKFDVSYRLDNGEDRSLVAQLVPHERAELPWEVRSPVPDGIRAISLICKLSEPAPGLIAWLTVRHHDASIGKHWRSGVFLRHPIADYASEALLELRADTRLVIEVRAPSPDMFFNVLRDSVEHLMRKRWRGLDHQLLIPCPGRHPDDSYCDGEFPLSGLLRYRERGGTNHSCLQCLTDHDVSQLLTGFAVPASSLRPELERLHHEISSLSEGVGHVQRLSAETADSVRKIIKSLATEVTDCPRLFTLASKRSTGFHRIKFYEERYTLALWCEHPGHWHTWPAATYHLHQPKGWLVDVAPYAHLVLKTLKVAVPIAAAVAGVEMPKEQIEHAKYEIELMKTLVDKLPQPMGELDPYETRQDQLSPAEGQALRSFRALLFRNDPGRTFGGLRRVQAPSGELLWVCTHHYPKYDPGLPDLNT